LSSSMQVEFGKSLREKFSYLIVSGIFIFMTVLIFKTGLKLAGMDEQFLLDYDLFYSAVGAGLGFIFAQIFIRLHIKAVKTGRI